jgi:hypothetical protein
VIPIILNIIIIVCILSGCSVIAGIIQHLEDLKITDINSSYYINFVIKSYIVFSASYMGAFYYAVH